MSRAPTFAVLVLAVAPVAAQAQTGDRYGPGVGPSSQAAVAAPLRVLSWPGKASTPTAAAAPQPAAYAPPRAFVASGPPGYVAAARAVARPAAYAPPPRVGPTMAAQDGWRPVYPGAPGPAASPVPAPPIPALAGAPQAQTAPTSIYAPARGGSPLAARVAAAPPPRGVPAARRYGYDPTTQHTVRFYSVSRPFGLQPDPAPIPPQFFTATADLSEPPGPLPQERTGAASTSTGRTVRAAPDTSTN